MFSFHDEATAFQHGNQGTQTSVHVQETLSFPAEQQFPTHCGKKLSHSWQKDSCRSVAPTMWARSNIHIPSINRVCMFKKYFNSRHNDMQFQKRSQTFTIAAKLSAFTIPASTQCTSSRNLFHSIIPRKTAVSEV